MPPKNKIDDLRNHLFETLEALKDDEKPMEVDRAKAICDVAQTIINSAKVELAALELTGQESQSEFLGIGQPAPLQLPAGEKPNGGERKRP